MTAGRPTAYNKNILVRTKDYLANYKSLGDAIPSVAGLSVELGIARSTIYDWASQEDKKEFSDMLQGMLSTQERVLISNGLTNVFNSNIAKLVLAKHGYADKSETDVTSKGKELNTLDPKVIAMAKEFEEKMKKGL